MSVPVSVQGKEDIQMMLKEGDSDNNVGCLRCLDICTLDAGVPRDTIL